VEWSHVPSHFAATGEGIAGRAEIPNHPRRTHMLKTREIENAPVRSEKLKPRHRWRMASRFTRWAVALALVALAVRLALPFVLQAYVNRQLDKTPDYDGRVGDIDVHLWRGAYQIKDVEIFKTTGDIPVPFFAASKVDLSMEWKELFHGALAGEVVMVEPRLNFVSGPTPDQTQTGEDKGWGRILESLFPFKLNRCEIERGQIHFKNLHSSPPVDIFVDQVAATATNLTNSRDLKQELPAGIRARGRTLGGGGLEFQLQLNPLAADPTYELTGQLTNVNLVALNDFLKAYGKFDVESGVFGLYASVASKDASYEGYLKVFFEDLNVFEWEKERKKNALEVFWQAIVGTLTTVFKNQPKDSLATKVAISGSYKNTDVHIWSAMMTLLRNAFVRALVPRLDQKVTVGEVEEKKEQKRQPPFVRQKGAERLTRP